MSNQITEQQLSEAIKQNVLSIAYKCVFSVPDADLPAKIDAGIKLFMAEFIKAVAFKDFTSAVEVSDTAITIKMVVNHLDPKYAATNIEAVLPIEATPTKSKKILTGDKKSAS